MSTDKTQPDSVQEDPVALDTALEDEDAAALLDDDSGGASAEGTDEAGDEESRLDLTVKIDQKGACERHVTVTVPRLDIERYLDEAFSEMMSDALVPGFRKGRAPRKLVEARFRKEVFEKVKGELLMDSVAQVTEDEELAAISEPDFDPFAIELPGEGPLTFEFDIEVRPEFDVPDWKGLKIDRPTREFTEEDVEAHMKEVVAEQSRPVYVKEPAQKGDYIATDIIVKHDGKVVNEMEEELVRLLPVLSFRDGKLLDFNEKMAGVREGETREASLRLTQDAPNEELRAKEVTAEFRVIEVRRLELPKLTPDLLEDIGDFDSEDEFRQAVRNSLERQLAYEQMQAVRRQITAALTEQANWELPPEMLRRQASRELERSIMEMQSQGFTDAQIRAHENELRQNIVAETARALKEHFILERIAEEEQIEVEDDEVDGQIRAIAVHNGETPRRVRARLEKAGSMDAVRNQIVEQKVLQRILDDAEYNDVPYKMKGPQVEAVNHAAGGGDQESAIPEAKSEHPEEREEAPDEARQEEEAAPA